MMALQFGHAGSTAAARELALYQQGELLTADTAAETATYYSSEVAPEDMTAIEQLGQAVQDQETAFSDALDELMREALPADAGINEVELRLSEELADAAGRADVRASMKGEITAQAIVRADMTPEMAKLLALDPKRPATL